MTRFLFAWTLLPLALIAQPTGTRQASADATFDKEIRPLLQQYCLACHSTARHTGDVDLEQFNTSRGVLRDTRTWQKVVDQLSIGEMPPKAMPQPTLAERARLLGWVNGALMTAARAQAGDPGPVVLRRLNNAEYTFTIRDLTGLALLEPTKEFPADGAAGEGFMNTGNAQSMSPSLVTKYLDAGKMIAGHAVLQPGGIRFSSGSSQRDWTNELLSEIRALYAEFTDRGGADTVTQQGMALDKDRGGVLPLRRYLAASLSLRGPSGMAAVEAVARKNRLSPKYLGALLALLKSKQPSPLLDGLRLRWQSANVGDLDAMVNEIGLWQNTLWKFSSVGHIGKQDGPKAWMEPVNPIVNQQDFRVKLTAPESGNEVTVYLTARDAGDGQAGDAVVWQEPKLAIPGRQPVLLQDLRRFVDEITERRTRIFAATASSLKAADEAYAGQLSDASRSPEDPESTKAWLNSWKVIPTTSATATPSMTAGDDPPNSIRPAPAAAL